MNIDALIKESILNKNTFMRDALRAFKAELLLNSTSKNPKPEGKIVFTVEYNNNEYNISELDLSILRKLTKEREEQILLYSNNPDLANEYRKQLEIYQILLPAEVSRDTILEYLVTAYPSGFPKNTIGKVIKELLEVYPTADKKVVGEVTKNYINN